MTTPTDFESVWNEGEDTPVGTTAAALTAARQAADSATQDDFVNAFKAETPDAATKADAASTNVANTAAPVPMVPVNDDGKTTDITKAAE